VPKRQSDIPAKKYPFLVFILAYEAIRKPLAAFG